MKRLHELTGILNAANRAYYQDDRPIMSDIEYDKLYDELLQLEANTGIVLAGSPTKTVGYEVVSNLVKVPHETPMLSLDKTKSEAALVDFLGDHTGVLSWKLDGLAIALKYEGGMLEQALTRGNGTVGEDVTHNAKVFANIPLTVPYKGRFTLRGEAVITFADFEAINAHAERTAHTSHTTPNDEIKYKNPRNLCSGAVRQLNSEVTAKRRVLFYAFGLLPGADVSFALKSEQLAWIDSLGFETTFFTKVTANTVVKTVHEFKAKVPTEPVASDGLVLTYDDVAYSESLGATSKFPKDSLAFKWQDELAETTLIDIEWSTSRTGLINPVAIFEPVDIEGTQVSRASLHNVSILRSLGLAVGNTISVYKANMIIPQVAENLSPKTQDVSVPDKCPVCFGKAEIVGDPETLYCTNPGCDAKLIQSLVHFVSRDAMNIEGLSEQTLDKFIEKGFIRDYPDLFGLAHFEQEITTTEGFGRKSYDNLIAATEASKDIALANFIYALGIKDVGLSNAKLLCAHFDNDIDAIVNEAARPVPAVFEDVKGIGESTAEKLRTFVASWVLTRQSNPPEPINGSADQLIASSQAPHNDMRLDFLSTTLQNNLYNFFDNNEAAIMEAANYTPADKPFGAIKGFGKEIITNLRNYFTDENNLAKLQKVLPLLRIQKTKAETSQPLSGLTFVITGDVAQFKNRKALQEFIEIRGGKVTGSVSANTSYLINNDAASSSGKNKKAAQLGVPILTENEFVTMCPV